VVRASKMEGRAYSRKARSWPPACAP